MRQHKDNSSALPIKNQYFPLLSGLAAIRKEVGIGWMHNGNINIIVLKKILGQTRMSNGAYIWYNNQNHFVTYYQ
jgi:hypothetical protein